MQAGQLLTTISASTMSVPYRCLVFKNHLAQSMPERQKTRGYSYDMLCTEQDTSQALQTLASMPKDTLVQKMRAQGELS